MDAPDLANVPPAAVRQELTGGYATAVANFTVWPGLDQKGANAFLSQQKINRRFEYSTVKGDAKNGFQNTLIGFDSEIVSYEINDKDYDTVRLTAELDGIRKSCVAFKQTNINRKQFLFGYACHSDRLISDQEVKTMLSSIDLDYKASSPIKDTEPAAISNASDLFCLSHVKQRAYRAPACIDLDEEVAESTWDWIKDRWGR